MTASSAAIAATAGGCLLPLAILLPALGVLLSLLHSAAGRRNAIALGLMPVELGIAARDRRVSSGAPAQPLVYTLGGYRAAARHRAASRRIFRRDAR